MIGVNILLTGFFLLPLAANGFNYDNPLSWLTEVPLCAGIRQSPIALDHTRDVPRILLPIKFHNFEIDLAAPVHVANNGFTIEMDVQSTINGFHPFITGGGLNAIYQLEIVHFHWGSPQSKGSEHALGGLKYDLEMHMVSKNKKFKTIEEAREDPFGLAVMGVLFKQVDDPRVPVTGLDTILELLPSLTKPYSEATLRQPLNISSLMGGLNPEKFYTYRGSLTTPPCSQAVTWIVFEDILPIQTSLLQQFWRITDVRGLPLLNNFRPLQLQNQRKIFSRKFFSNK